MEIFGNLESVGEDLTSIIRTVTYWLNILGVIFGYIA
jgi:hypothetical protein